MQQRLFNRSWQITLTACLLFALTAAAQEEAGAEGPRSLFGEVIDVRVVNLEVVVTARGERVTGLDPQDFVLTVDRQEVPIDYFTEVHDGVAVAREAGHTMVPTLDPGKPVGTSYLLFIDEYLSLEVRRNLVLRKMIAQLPNLGPEDRMAVVAYNGRRLEMLGTWTSSPADLERTFEEALARPSFGMRQRVQERAFLSTAQVGDDPVPGPLPVPDGADDISGSAPLTDPVLGNATPGLALATNRVATSTGLTNEEEQQVAWLTSRVLRVVSAATAAMRSFADPPGRKVMLLMSGGWPDNPTDWLLRDSERVEISRAADRHRIYGPLIETANRLSYTLYPIDVPGASDSGVDITRATLRRLARETGGKPMLAGDGLRALEKTVADTRSYYWIGFVPQWKGDDRAHRVDVKVRRKGLEARTRRNFSDLSRDSEVTMMVESMLRLGEEPVTTPFPAQAGAAEKAGMGKVEVPLELLVPVHALTFLPHQDHFVAEVELRVAVQDHDGTAADIPVTPLTITLDEPPEEGDMRRWETRIKIRDQPHDVVVSLYDNASGKIISTRLAVDPKVP